MKDHLSSTLPVLSLVLGFGLLAAHSHAVMPYPSQVIYPQEYAEVVGPSVGGDFDGDGRQDLAVTHGPLTVFAGSAEGTLIPGPSYSTGLDVLWVGAGHLNGDADLDLVVVGQGGVGEVQVLIGGAGAEFVQLAGFTTMDYPDSALLQDFNNDGKLDLVVGNGFELKIYLGVGDGTFGAGSTVSSGGLSIGPMVSADFTGNGLADLVTRDVLLAGNNDGTFGAPVLVPFSGSSVLVLVTRDFNGDGIPDLAAGIGSGGGLLEVMAGNGDGTFSFLWSESIASGSIEDLDVGNFDGVGAEDLVLVVDDGAYVYSAVGDGTFVSGPFAPAHVWAYFGEPLEINHDGNLDLAVSSSSGVLILTGNGDGTLASRSEETFTSNTITANVVLTDLDLDGHIDMVVPGTNGSSLGAARAAFGRGDGTFEPEVAVASSNMGTVASVLSGDFDGNGLPDIAAQAANGLNIFLGLGGRTFGNAILHPEVKVPNVWAGGTVGDFNADGRLDLALSTADWGGTSVRLGHGDGTFGPPAYLIGELYDLHIGLAVGDFNADGAQDLAGAGSWPTSVWLGRGDGSFSPAADYIQPNVFETLSVTVLDFDGDTHQDIIVGRSSDTPIGFLRGVGDGTFVNGPAPAGACCTPMVGSDLNLDGYLDLVGGHGYPGPTEFNLTLGGAGGAFSPNLYFASTVHFASDLAIADLDENGTPDVVTVGFGESGISLNQTAPGDCLDADGDGYGAPGQPGCPGGLPSDCDDFSSTTFPGAVEVCDLKDNDCDQMVDEGHDADGDKVTVCNGDCDDTDPATHRFAVENCSDGKDNDCDGRIDDQMSFFVGTPKIDVKMTSLAWEKNGFDVRTYDLIRGNLQTLHDSGGDFATAVQECIVNDAIHRDLALDEQPATGGFFFYLVRGGNCRNPGSFDSYGASQEAARDAGIAASPAGCP